MDLCLCSLTTVCFSRLPGKSHTFCSRSWIFPTDNFPGHNFKNGTLICRISYVSVSVWSSLSLAFSLQVAVVSNNVHSVQPKLYREGLFFIVAHARRKKNMYLLHFRNRGLIRGMRCFEPAGSCSTDIHWRAFASATFSVLTVVIVGEKFSDCCRT
jgi:hypothetical protein